MDSLDTETILKGEACHWPHATAASGPADTATHGLPHEQTAYPPHLTSGQGNASDDAFCCPDAQESFLKALGSSKTLRWLPASHDAFHYLAHNHVKGAQQEAHVQES